MLATLAVAFVLSQSSEIPGSEVGEVKPGGSVVADVPISSKVRGLSVLVSLDKPASLTPGKPVSVKLAIGTAGLEKTLHIGDPDVAWMVAQPAGVGGKVTIEADPAHPSPIPFVVRFADIGPDCEDAAFEVEPNDAPEDANRLILGRLVFGLADDRPYLPIGETPTVAESTVGKDWYRFDYENDDPALAFFGLEFVDRDVPPDVRIYTLDDDGEPVLYTQGIDPQSLQREKPPRPGANKFTTRVLTKGTYYVLVDACQPAYRLRTSLRPVPPYLKSDGEPTDEEVAGAARRAIRTAMDFQLASGDSWHANTPRQGHPLDRVANPHHETSTCIACHPTHFTTQSALEAVHAGYPIGEPRSLDFLIERLANNPVPLYGHPEALWARMIPAPANVMGRLSTIVQDHENLVGGPPRAELHRGVAELLKLVYDGRDALPPDESNGNNPVSRYKVAADAWRQLDEVVRRTGESRYVETRERLADLLATGEPDNTRDLAAQTIGLCRVDRKLFDASIQKNVERLRSLQRPDGNWSVKFDPDYPVTEMQTGESLYALSLAGLGPDDPAIRKGVVTLLRSQDEFGGWLDINPYEQFRTPFRETQWALMAFSRLYPNPEPGAPHAPNPPKLRLDTPSGLVADLERVWSPPDSALKAQMVAALESPIPVARVAAAEAIGRVGDRNELSTLTAHLGDESKAVRRAAAEAVRRLGNRFNAADGPGETLDQVALVTALEAALESPDDRTRRGATSVFAAHFRDLSREDELADALIWRLEDIDPVVRMQAAKGLWRWWYWQADPDLRGRIEDAMIDRLGEEPHPWVRRNLTDALYILNDENIRYLYNNWLPTLNDPADRDRAEVAQHATVNRLAAKYVEAIQGDNLQRRMGVLRSLSEFSERPAITGGRIGNDIEPAQFYDEALPAMSEALIATMADPDPTLRRLALQGLVTLKGHKEAALARSILARLGDDDPEVRRWAAAMGRSYPVAVAAGADDPALASVVANLSASPIPEARAAALDVLAGWGPSAEPSGLDRGSLVIDSLDDPDGSVRASALAAIRGFPVRLELDSVRSKLVEALTDPDPTARLTAIRLVLDGVADAPEADLDRAIEDDDPAHRSALLGAIAESDAYASDLRLVGLVSDALRSDDSGVRERALQAIQKHSNLVANPAVADSLRELAGSDNVRQAEVARVLAASRGRSSGAGSADGTVALDLGYFEAKVLPIFLKKGEDTQSCMGCHRSHTILKMVGRDEGRWTPDRVLDNYRAALRVVDLARPSESLLLNKPTWEAAAEAEAQGDPSVEAHAGGVRFLPDSEEHQIILDWINGARLDEDR